MDQSIINFKVYEDSVEYVGMAQATLPDLTALTQSISGAGIAGNVESVILGHFDAMTLGLNFRTVTDQSVKLSEPRRHTIDLRVAQQDEDVVAGKVVVRARTEFEEHGKDRMRIIVTELPYQVNKRQLIKNIAEQVKDKRLDGISDLRDETDRNGMRVVIELKKDANPQVVLNNLFKQTALQSSFGIIMLALVDGQPRVLSLKEMLSYYVLHQEDGVTRRTKYDLEKSLARAHILEGLLKALDHIDEIVHVIRNSKDTGAAKIELMERFQFSDKQAQAILDMRLARLTGLERDKLLAEYNELENTIAYLRSLLEDRNKLMGVVKNELTEIKNKFNDPRRTELSAVEGEIDIADLIAVDDMVVTLTHFGYVKRLPKSPYKSQNRGGKGVAAMTTREDDYAENIRVVNSHEPIMFFTNQGRVYNLTCYQIPEAGRTAKGTAIVNLLQLAAGEKVTTMIPMPEIADGHYLIMATREGVIKKTALSEFKNLRKAGLISIVLDEGDELIGVELTDDDDELMLATRQGQAIRFKETDIRSMGRNSMGVKSFDLAENDEVISVARIEAGKQVLAITQNGYGKRTGVSEFRVQSRGGKGIMAMRLTDKTGLMAAQLLVSEDEDIMLITDDGTIIRMPVSDISVIGRVSQGVRVMRVEEGSRIVCVTATERDEDEQDESEDGQTEADSLDMDVGGENSETQPEETDE